MTRSYAPLAAPDVDDLPVAVWVGKAPSGETIYANPALFALLGKPPPRAEWPTLRSRHAGAPDIQVDSGQRDDLDAFARLPFVRALQARTSVTVSDMLVERPDGTNVAVRAVARPIFCDAGNLRHVIIAFSEMAHGTPANSDFDEVASLRRALQASEELGVLHERLRDAVNHAPLLIFAVDRYGTFTLAEGSALSQLGMTTGQVVGTSIFDLYRDHDVILDNVKRALQGESFTGLVEIGGLVFETWYAPIACAEGGVLGVATDVTERRRMQATLLSAERMVTIGTIAASVAHEINNPLSYVIACLELLLRDSNPVLELTSLLAARYPGDSEVTRLAQEIQKAREPFENIRDGIERMRLIARDLLTFARVDDHELAPVDVRDVLRSAIRMASNETRHRASVVTDFSPVPWVMASEPRLAQVFLNLLVNAAQAFPDDGRPGSCDIRISTFVGEGGRVVVEVRDNGPGIDPGVLPRIFEPFFTTKPVGVGTGLGLSVCRNIVLSYGGEIRAYSDVAKGSTFVVTLPAAAGPAPASSKRQAMGPPSRPSRVLVIDDDKVLGNAFRMTLAREFDVRVVASGSEALSVLADDGTFDFIFCDLMMPEMSGMDVFAELLRRQPEVAEKVLFMTGGVYSPEVRAFIARVPNRCLQKPFDPALVIREALARRK
jgi:PAS domain S-box-containing protein